MAMTRISPSVFRLLWVHLPRADQGGLQELHFDLEYVKIKAISDISHV